MQERTWPADRVERRSVASLVPYARNARTHSPEQVDQVAASIREWGWTMPVLVDEENGLIAGHARVLAATKLGLAHIPVMVATGWSDAQKRAYILADNKLALNAGWNDALLKVELGDLQTMAFDLALTGFSLDEIAGLTVDRTVGQTDPDDAPDAPADPVSVLGDVWTLGRHRLLCGDATKVEDVQRVLDGVRPNVMITDPPYGVNYNPAWRARAGVNLNPGKLGKVDNDDRADWGEAWALFPGSVAYVWHAGKFAALVQTSLEAHGFDVRSQIIWAKDRFALSRGDYHWQHEPCWYAVRRNGRGHWCGDRSQSTLWTIRAREGGGFGHGTQKPVECMKRPIEEQLLPRPGRLRPVRGFGYHLHRRRDDGKVRPRPRTQSDLRRRGGDAMGELHRPAGHSGGQRGDLRRDRQTASAGGERGARGDRWFRYVRHGDRPRFEAQGWIVVADLGPTHGYWSVLMELLHGAPDTDDLATSGAT